MSLLNTSNPNSLFNVIDGWGGNLHNGGVISESFRPAAVNEYSTDGSTSPLPPGAIVQSASDANGPIVEVPLLDTNVNLDADKRRVKRYWMVATGNTAGEYSGRAVNKATCIRGEFTVETAHVKGTPAVGARLTVEHDTTGTVGALLPHQTTGGGASGVNLGRLTEASAGDPVLGYVIDTRTENGFTVYVVEMSL